jgi:peptide-methionine (S)-S-oxide reductase
MRAIVQLSIALVVLMVGPFSFASNQPAKAIFAGGCFWCLQADFDKMPGVEKTVVGYTGGHMPNPDYRSVSQQNTGHYEAVEVFYDPSKTNYKALLKHFWLNIDPLDDDGQFCDQGASYRAAIFYMDNKQKKQAESSKAAMMKEYKLPRIDTLVLPAREFYPAEDYHQSYYLKNPIRYHYYRDRCGRDARLEAVWHKD